MPLSVGLEKDLPSDQASLTGIGPGQYSTMFLKPEDDARHDSAFSLALDVTNRA